MWLNTLKNGDTDKLLTFIDGLWQEKCYREAFDFLLSLTRQFVEDWKAPADEDWLYQMHYDEYLPDEITEYHTFISLIDEPLAKATLMAQLHEGEVKAVRGELELLPGPLDCGGAEAREQLEGEGYELEKTVMALEDYWQFKPDVSEFLIPLYLDIYDRQGQSEKYLTVANQYGFSIEYLLYLVKLGRIEQVMAEFQGALGQHSEYLQLIQVLFDHHRSEALTVVSVALDLKVEESQFRYGGYDRGTCYRWLAEHLNPTADDERLLFFKAADQTMAVNPDIAIYQRRESYTDADQWVGVRAEYLERCQSSSECVDVLIYSGEYDMACRHLENNHSWYYLSDRKFLDALAILKNEKPEWVIKFCTLQADALIAETKVSRYPDAVAYLAHVKAVCLVNNRSDEWRKVLLERITTHKRKIRLVPQLEELGFV